MKGLFQCPPYAFALSMVNIHSLLTIVTLSYFIISPFGLIFIPQA